MLLTAKQQIKLGIGNLDICASSAINMKKINGSFAQIDKGKGDEVDMVSVMAIQIGCAGKGWMGSGGGQVART